MNTLTDKQINIIERALTLRERGKILATTIILIIKDGAFSLRINRGSGISITVDLDSVPLDMPDGHYQIFDKDGFINMIRSGKRISLQTDPACLIVGQYTSYSVKYSATPDTSWLINTSVFDTVLPPSIMTGINAVKYPPASNTDNLYQLSKNMIKATNRKTVKTYGLAGKLPAVLNLDPLMLDIIGVMDENATLAISSSTSGIIRYQHDGLSVISRREIKNFIPVSKILTGCNQSLGMLNGSDFYKKLKALKLVSNEGLLFTPRAGKPVLATPFDSNIIYQVNLDAKLADTNQTISLDVPEILEGLSAIRSGKIYVETNKTNNIVGFSSGNYSLYIRNKK